MTGEAILKTRDQLKGLRTPLEGHWNELSEQFMPFRLSQGSNLPDIFSAEKVFDSTARRSALILANGLASLVTPREEVWFEYQAPKHLRGDDDAVKFYRECSEIAREYLEASNFYEEIQEAYISSPVFGTAALYCGDLDERGELHYRHQPIQTYYIAEDAKGRVNCFYRELKYTADQAAEEFGAEVLPEEVRGRLGKPEAKTEQSDYIHAVFRRTGPAEKDAPESASKPWVSMVVHENSRTVVESEGYDEFPFAVHRYRRFGYCVYGFGPGTIAIGDARQLQFLNELADVAAEKAVFPPLIAPSSLEGEIGQGALEITYVDPTDPNSAAMLREWAGQSRYDVAKDRMGDKREQIERVFHVDLFQLFSIRSQERAPLTATEAGMIAGEKLSQFSPVFGRLVSEMLDPVLSRLFGVLLRAGKFGQPPASVTGELGGGKRMGVAAPGVLYKNRIMLAMQERQNGSLLTFMQLAQPVLELYPEAADALNLPNVVREAARNSGMPESWIRSKKEVEAMQAQRADAQQAQQQMAMAEQAAGIAAQAGKIPADMREQMGRAISPEQQA
jgi:hypothetical protein